jgi:hypothetical protein
MQPNLQPDVSSPQAQFCLHFIRHLEELFLKRRYSVAQGFGPAWEKAMEEVPLEDEDQPSVYWQLIRWAKQTEFCPDEPDRRRAA